METREKDPPIGPMPLEMFRLVVEASNDAVVVTSPDLDHPGPRIEYVNPAFTRLTGYAPEEVIGQTPRILQGPKTDRALLDRLRRDLETRGEFEGQTTNYRKDGTEYQLQWRITPLRGPEGGVAHWVAIQRDVTERMSTEAALQESEEHYRLIVESAIDFAIFTMDLDGRITTWSPGAENVLGYAEEEAIGQSTDIIFIPEDLAEGAPEGERQAALEKGRAEDERWHLRKDGSRFFGSGLMTPLRDGGDEPLGFLKILRDATEHQRMDEALRNMNAELERRVEARTQDLVEANREMEGFTYTVSHDLRGPLRAIMSTSMILLEDFGDQLDADGRAELRRQSANAKKLNSLIDDLLKLSRLGRAEMTKEEFDLSAMAADVAKELDARDWPRAPHFHIAEGLKAYGDQRLLRLVVHNLLENSCKFAKVSISPNIEVGRGDDGVYFVKDDGIGFPPEKAKDIFTIFTRLHRDDEIPGTGVGLANVKRVVERHGGKIWAEGREGEGATFFFTLGA